MMRTNNKLTTAIPLSALLAMLVPAVGCDVGDVSGAGARDGQTDTCEADDEDCEAKQEDEDEGEDEGEEDSDDEESDDEGGDRN